MNHVQLLFNKSFFHSMSEMSAVSSVIESYKKTCGFFDCELQIGTTEKMQNNNTNSVFLLDKNNGQEYACELELTEEMHNRIETYVKGIFRFLAESFPQFRSTIPFFVYYRLWEPDILSQFCMSDNRLIKQIELSCHDALAGFDSQRKEYTQEVFGSGYSEERIAEDHTELQHSQYVQIYLIFLEEICSKRINEKKSNNQKLKDLAKYAYSQYRVSDNIIFIKLAAMIYGNAEMLKYSEDMYKRYLMKIKGLRKSRREMSETFYDLGRVFETYSENRSIFNGYRERAFNYYQLSSKYCPENYKALYKLVFLPNRKEYGLQKIQSLEHVYQIVKERELQVGGTLRVHLYDYKLLNHMAVFYTRWIRDNYQAMKLIQQAENKYIITINNIWKQLGLFNYEESFSILQNYLKARTLYHNKAIIVLRNEGSDSVSFKNAYKELMSLRK